MIRKFDIEKFKKVIEQHANPSKGYSEYYQLPDQNRMVIVLNVDEKPIDHFYGAGPMCVAFAQLRYLDDGTFVWLNQYEDPLSCNDFRDVANHNNFGHSEKVSHWMDVHDLSGLFFNIF